LVVGHPAPTVNQRTSIDADDPAAMDQRRLVSPMPGVSFSFVALPVVAFSPSGWTTFSPSGWLRPYRLAFSPPGWTTFSPSGWLRPNPLNPKARPACLRPHARAQHHAGEAAFKRSPQITS